MGLAEEDLFNGVQLPKASVREPKIQGVKQVILEQKMTNDEIKAREGTYFSEKDADTIYDDDVDLYVKDPDAPGGKRLLARLRKNVIPHDLIKLAWKNFYKSANASRNRGAAAGPIDQKSKYWTRRKLNKKSIKGWSAQYMQNGKLSKMRVNNNVFSSVLGYFEKTPFMKLPCRITSYTMRYWKYYKHGLPFIRAIDKCFATLVPDRYKLQRAAAEEKPFLHITDTAFSSVTINRNFRTALHRDAGDFREGYGNLSVIERGEYHGGFTLFPQYGIGFNVRTGDFLAMDVHQWHCNTELYETEADKKANKDLPNIHKDNHETGTLGSE